ncbi:hypothetical protein [Variovorax sp. J22R115]|uniref:hypothetical protein n=1 Tax=Variovorax sp. J22R115 TaxID=3053509 RepID=UPI0025761E58|nr:hypothetical protein [Variovorax sp. J22R115]MDM0051412.1 hypothetical protein [Variovorax sp. J22R115]
MKPESNLAQPGQPTARTSGSALRKRQRKPLGGKSLLNGLDFLNHVDRRAFDHLTDSLELAMHATDLCAKGKADREAKRAELLEYFRQKYGVNFLRSVTESQSRRSSAA